MVLTKRQLSIFLTAGVTKQRAQQKSDLMKGITSKMDLKVILKDLEGKGEAELRNLHADALVAEAQAKKDLVLVRQRIQMLGSSVETEEEKWVVDAKALLVDAQTYLTALET